MTKEDFRRKPPRFIQFNVFVCLILRGENEEHVYICCITMFIVTLTMILIKRLSVTKKKKTAMIKFISVQYFKQLIGGMNLLAIYDKIIWFQVLDKCYTAVGIH